MKKILFYIFCFSIQVDAQLSIEYKKAAEIADSVMINGMGKDFFKAYITKGSVNMVKSPALKYNELTKKGEEEMLYEVWYYINIYNKIDSLEITLHSNFVVWPGIGDPHLPDSIQYPLKYPILAKQEFWKQFKKEKGIKKTLTFEFGEDGIIAFFYCRKRLPSDPACKWSMAIDLQNLINLSGHWWCEH